MEGNGEGGEQRREEGDGSGWAQGVFFPNVSRHGGGRRTLLDGAALPYMGLTLLAWQPTGKGATPPSTAPC
jgi:hypothetical protein